MNKCLFYLLVFFYCTLAFPQSVSEIKSDNSYLSGEGWGNTLKQADDAALQDLVSKISVNVRSSFTSAEEETTKNGKLVAAYEFYNDNAKWDWWQEGGRFSTSDGRILFKDGHSADHGYVKDIDIDGMVERAKAKRAKTYDYVMEKFGGKPELKITWRKDIAPVLNRWSELLKKHDYDIPQDVCDYHWKMVDKLRDLYHAQPDVARWEEVFGWGYDIENFLCSREEYIDNFELPLWAICDEDGWYEPTEMGWWAMHADYESKSWTEQAIEVLKKNIKKAQEEDNELYITTIDCHI